MFCKNDGGRAAAGFKGATGDCATRAIAIATGMSYKDAYNLINQFGEQERGRKRNGKIVKSDARTGVFMPTMKKIMLHLGWRWMPTMTIGSGCKTHLIASELPKGKIICSVSRHFVAVVDGVVHDTYNSSREGTRCVYGYWFKP